MQSCTKLKTIVKQEPSCEETSPVIYPVFASLTSLSWLFPEGAFLYATWPKKKYIRFTHHLSIDFLIKTCNHTCYILPYMWLDEWWCEKLLALVVFIHVPGNRILFESIPSSKNIQVSWLFQWNYQIPDNTPKSITYKIILSRSRSICLSTWDKSVFKASTKIRKFTKCI